MTYTETDLITTIEALAGADLGVLSRAQRDQFDQFHAGGAEAVDRIMQSLVLQPGMSVLDVGSGFGGPARQIAISSGCKVVGVDITAAYVEAAAALTRAAGLEGQVEFACGEVASLDRDDFDAAYTMHVQMNVADKHSFFSAIAQRLRPGAPLATYEVCRAGASDPDLPLPWSIDGSDSFLATPDDLHNTVVSGGFKTRAWVDETDWVISWFDEVGARLALASSSATLPALLDDGPTRLMNFAVGLSTGVLSIHRGLFVAA